MKGYLTQTGMVMEHEGLSIEYDGLEDTINILANIDGETYEVELNNGHLFMLMCKTILEMDKRN